MQVIAATTLDVHRHLRANEQPVTPEQQRALEAWLAQFERGDGKPQ